MRILVIDDSELHRNAAFHQLKNHDLTTISTYEEAEEVLQNPNHGFEVVLADLLMPASRRAQGEGKKYVGQEMPVGIFLALLAAKTGAKYVAVLTDSDHHAHPASACFDPFNPKGETRPTSLNVQGARLILSNARMWVPPFRREDLSTPLDWDDPSVEYDEQGELTNAVVMAKDWKSLLEYLLQEQTLQ